MRAIHGEFFERLRKPSGVTCVDFVVEKRTTSAGAPSASVPHGRAEDARGRRRQHLDEALERDRARDEERVHENRQGRLEPRHAERRVRELERLLVLVVRRVVGRDAVDRPVDERGDERRRGRPRTGAAGSS